MYSSRKLLTSLLIFIFFVNTIGITQVSHICSMAASTASFKGIVTDNCESHECCPEDEDSSLPGSPESKKDCCKDVVKYFQQKVNTTLNPVFKIQPVLALVPNFLLPENFAGNSECVIDFPDESFSNHHTGKSILINKQSFLI